MAEQGPRIDHSTIYRWVQQYAPQIERRLRWQWRPPRSKTWRKDETYIKVRGKWAYLYRAVDKFGDTIVLYLSPTRNTKAAKRFQGKALKGLKSLEQPRVINTDKAPTYGTALPDWSSPRGALHRAGVKVGQFGLIRLFDFRGARGPAGKQGFCRLWKTLQQSQVDLPPPRPFDLVSGIWKHGANHLIFTT